MWGVIILDSMRTVILCLVIIQKKIDYCTLWSFSDAFFFVLKTFPVTPNLNIYLNLGDRIVSFRFLCFIGISYLPLLPCSQLLEPGLNLQHSTVSQKGDFI